MPHNLAIIGYGKMGKLIESLAPEYNFDVKLKLDIHAAVPENVRLISALGVNLVVGATGWLERIDEVREAVQAAHTGLIWSPNFSIGMQAFFRIVAEAARLMSNEQLYESWAWEIHHSAKKDAPSGTLLKLVEEMKSAGYHHRIDVASNRAGSIPGTHEIGFDSSADTITLRHTARSREGFARGALKAAQWVIGKQGFFEFADILFK